MSTLRWHTSRCHSERKSSSERPALRRAPPPWWPPPPRLRSPGRPASATCPPAPTRCATGVAVALLVLALLLPWNLEFGLGVPDSNGLLFVLIAVRDAARDRRGPHPTRRPVPAGRPRRPTSAAPAGSGLLLSIAYLDRRDRLRRVPPGADPSRRRNRPGAAGRRPRPDRGYRGRNARRAAADHQYHHRGQRFSALVRGRAAAGRGVDRARDAVGRASTCIGGCAICSSRTSTSAVRMSRSSSPRCSTARRR